MSLVREKFLSAVLDDIVAVVRAVARVGGLWVMLSVLFVCGIWVKHRCDSVTFPKLFQQMEASSGKARGMHRRLPAYGVGRGGGR